MQRRRPDGKPGPGWRLVGSCRPGAGVAMESVVPDARALTVFDVKVGRAASFLDSPVIDPFPDGFDVFGTERCFPVRHVDGQFILA